VALQFCAAAFLSNPQLALQPRQSGNPGTSGPSASKSVGYPQRLELIRLERDLLGQHDIAGGEIAPRCEAQAHRDIPVGIELEHVLHNAFDNAVALAGRAADDIELVLALEPRELRRGGVQAKFFLCRGSHAVGRLPCARTLLHTRHNTANFIGNLFRLP
jgi:hypothetical protein